MKSRVIGSEETHVPYRTIQNVVLRQGVFERLFDLGMVEIQNATAGGGNAILVGQPIDKANELVGIVRGIMGKANASGTGL